MKDEPNTISLDDFKPKGTNWIDFYVDGNYVTCFDSFEHIPKRD